MRLNKNESKTLKKAHLLKIGHGKDKPKIEYTTPYRVAPAFCIRFLTLLVRFLGVTKLQATFHPSKMATTVCRPATRSWKSRGGRRNEVAARGWILIKNRYITPIRGSATADYAASSLIRQRLFEPRLGWRRAQLSASMSRH